MRAKQAEARWSYAAPNAIAYTAAARAAEEYGVERFFAETSRMRLDLEFSSTSSLDPPPGWEDLLASAEEPSYFHGTTWTKAVCTHMAGHKPSWTLVQHEGRPVAGAVLVSVRTGPFTALMGHHVGMPAIPLLAGGLESDVREYLLDELC